MSELLSRRPAADATRLLPGDHREGFVRFLSMCRAHGIDTKKFRSAQKQALIERRIAAGEDLPGVTLESLADDVIEARIDSLHDELSALASQPASETRDARRRTALARLRAAQREMDRRAEALHRTKGYLEPGTLDDSLARARVLLGEHENPPSPDGASDDDHR
jgi:hypothetical protein